MLSLTLLLLAGCASEVASVLAGPLSAVVARGYGLTEDGRVASSSTHYSSCFIDCWDEPVYRPGGVFTQISASESAVCGARESGEVACWGAGGPIKLVDTDAPPGVLSTSDHGACVLADGVVHWIAQAEYDGASPHLTGSDSSWAAVDCAKEEWNAAGGWGLDDAGAVWVADEDGGTYEGAMPGGPFIAIDGECALNTDGFLVCGTDYGGSYGAEPGEWFLRLEASESETMQSGPWSALRSSGSSPSRHDGWWGHCGRLEDGDWECLDWTYEPGELRDIDIGHGIHGNVCTVDADGRGACWSPGGDFEGDDWYVDEAP